MAGALTGVKVLEVATWIAMPAAGMLMADMGADVVKVEAPGGDTWRGSRTPRGQTGPLGGNPSFELDNRGKRSIAINLDHPDGKAVIRRLVQAADVFTTNLVEQRRQRYAVTYADLAAINPRLIYAAFSGYGERGPDRDRLGFDYTAFWSRGGVLSGLGEPGSPPMSPHGTIGDHLTAPLLLAGVLAALYEREKSGVGQQVESSLLNAGLWANVASMQRVLIGGDDQQLISRGNPNNPLLNCYRTSDGRWFFMVMNGPTDWPKVANASGRADLLTDERFATPEARATNKTALVAELDAAFAVEPWDTWRQRLDDHGVIYGLVQRSSEAAKDPQVRANGYITDVPHPTLGSYESVATPLQFSRSETRPQGPAPSVGEHTDAVLAEVGYSSDDIAALRASGAVGAKVNA